MEEKARSGTLLKQKIYQYLKDEICSGSYKSGQQVHEQELANRFKSSRSPVREALKQLVSDGLLEEYPNRGVFVRTYSPKDMQDIFDLRELLENYAIRHVGTISPVNIRQLNDLLTSLNRFHEADDLEHYIEEDAILHHKIVSMCKNDLIIDTYNRISNMTQQFRTYSLKSRQRFDDSVEEHTRLIRSLLDGNTEDAAATNKKHLSLARDAIIRYLKSSETQ